MSQTQTLEQTELETLKRFQILFSELSTKHGSLHFQKKLIDKELQDVDAAFEEMERARSEFTENLTKKYGQGSVDISTGVFTQDRDS